MPEVPVSTVLADGLRPPEITRSVRELLQTGARVVAVDFERPRPFDADVACELARLQRFTDGIGVRLVVRTFADEVVAP